MDSSFAGSAYIYLGGASFNSTPDVAFTGTKQSDCFGNAVTGAGDVDGDGYYDVLIGAYLADIPAQVRITAGRLICIWEEHLWSLPRTGIRGGNDGEYVNNNAEKNFSEGRNYLLQGNEFKASEAFDKAVSIDKSFSAKVPDEYYSSGLILIK